VFKDVVFIVQIMIILCSIKFLDYTLASRASYSVSRLVVDENSPYIAWKVRSCSLQNNHCNACVLQVKLGPFLAYLPVS
jgi:hypothetical protein